MKRKKQLNAAQRKLRDDWEALLKFHARPLERGAKAKGVKQPVAIVSEPFSLPVAPDSSSCPPEKYRAKYVGTTARAASTPYTGNKMRGVAVMHKSNGVPVFSVEEAIEISAMRR